MTEAKMRVTAKNWRTITRPDLLRDFLLNKRKPTWRKVRLYAAATCRRFWDELPTPQCRALVEGLEDYLEGEVKWADVLAAKRAANASAASLGGDPRRAELFNAARSVADNRLWYTLAVYAWAFGYTHPGAWEREDSAQCDLIRDVFGDPFAKVKLRPAWLTDTVLALARQMYESREFGAMPILADALQDAGCDDQDVLGHCREANAVHVRGCWVVDLVLGKE